MLIYSQLLLFDSISNYQDWRQRRIIDIDSAIPRWRYEHIEKHEKIYEREYIVVVVIVMHVKRNA